MGKIVKLDRCVIQILGPDAQKLLHDTLTCNLSTPLGAQARWFALLAPQGKILVEGLISSFDEGYALDIPTSELENLSKRMRLYKMRADLTITPREDLAVGWSADPIEDGVQDARPQMGYRTYSATHADWDDDATAYHKARIAQSIMEMGADFEPTSVFPHDIGMDQLEGVDFKKGCYIGQEVVSRMQHRGTARKRPVSVVGPSLAIGEPIMCAGKSVGSVSSLSLDMGLALVRLDKVNDAENCTSNGGIAQLAIPSWASYGFSDS